MSSFTFAREIMLPAERVYIGKNEAGEHQYQTIPARFVRVVVSIDQDKLAGILGRKAVRNKSGKTRLVKGCITAATGAPLGRASERSQQ